MGDAVNDIFALSSIQNRDRGKKISSRLSQIQSQDRFIVRAHVPVLNDLPMTVSVT